MKKITQMILILSLMLSFSACGDDSITNVNENSSKDNIINDAIDMVESSVVTDILSELNAEDSDIADFHITPYGQGFFEEGRAWIYYQETNDAIKDKNDIIIDNSGAEQWAAIIDKQGNILWKKQGSLVVAEPFRDGLSYCLFDNGETESYIFLDSEGNETFTKEKDDTYIMLGHGNGLFLVAKHISTFDTNEWQIGAIDKHGETIVPFQVYEKLPPPGPEPVEHPGVCPDPHESWESYSLYQEYCNQLAKYEEYERYMQIYAYNPITFDDEDMWDYKQFDTCEYMGDSIFKLSFDCGDCLVLLNIETQKIIYTTDQNIERYNSDYIAFVKDSQKDTYFENGIATVLHTYDSSDERGWYKSASVVCTMSSDGKLTPLFENSWTEDVLCRKEMIFDDGLIYLGSSPIEELFPSGAYYNLEGECILDFPEYRNKNQYVCGSFVDGYATIVLLGADDNIYISAINKNGELMFEPKQGFTSASVVNEKCIAAITNGCVAVFDINGNLLHTIECACIQPENTEIAISEDILTIQDIFFNTENGTVIGKHMENDVTHRYNTYETMVITSYVENNSISESVSNENVNTRSEME